MAANFEKQYVKNNTYKLEFETTAYDRRIRKGYDLILDGYLFQRNRLNEPKYMPHSLNWRCVHKKICLGSATVQLDDDSISHFVQHEKKVGVSQEDYDRLHSKTDALQIEIKESWSNMKVRLLREDKTAEKIFVEERERISQLSSYSNESITKKLGPYSQHKTALYKYRFRKLGRNKLPKSIEQIVLAGDDLLTVKGEKFVIRVKSGNRMIVMASPLGLEILSKAVQWHVDGTFKSAAKFYHQLWIVHAWINQRMIPCAYALMSRRRAKDYNVVLQVLKNEARVRGLALKPQILMSDFETAEFNAFQDNFPGIKISGCLFHFAQAILRKCFTFRGYKELYSSVTLILTLIRALR